VTKRLDKLQQKKKQVEAQIQKLRAAEKSRQRKQETRKKFLIGAYYWQKACDEQTIDALAKEMEGFLTRNTDRALFELPPLDEKPDKTLSEQPREAEKMA